MKLKTFLEHVDYSCASKIFRFFVIVTCPVKAIQLMKFITISEKISVVGLSSVIRVLFKHDCRRGSNGYHCRCFIKLPVHIIKEVQKRDSFEMAISNEIGFDIV